jgi:glucose/arabinose dehydrogenase
MNRVIGHNRNLSSIAVAVALAGMAAVPAAGWAQGTNANCPEESVYYNPGNGEDIIVPRGFKVEVFARGLNFPTDVAFVGNEDDFKVYVLESGTGLPGKCNNNVGVYGGPFAPENPFTPDIIIFDDNGNRVSGRLGKPTSLDPETNRGFQPNGPAIGLSFEHDVRGGTLFGTDSNQGARGAPGLGNNTSRVVKVTDITRTSATVRPVIRGLPTGDHPTEQILVKDGWLYWSQGSATNSGVTGHDNGAGGNQHDIACQQITLSMNTWSSLPDGHVTSGYSNHGVARPGKVVAAYEGATSKGMCTGAILRARISDPQNSIEPVAWGFRNPYGLRFSPADHPLKGEIMISENGEDERGARPTNNAPDRLGIARQNPDGTPEWHGWPDRFGFLDSTQSVFNPKGSPGDDNPAATAGKPVLPVLAFFPQQPVAPIAIEPSDVAAVGLDFVPDSFVGGIVKKHAVLVSREGDFGFSQANGTPEAGHDVELVNFTSETNPYELRLLRFAFNCRQPDQRHDPDGTPKCAGPSEQAFVSKIRGINRPTTIRFGPDGAAYLVDYGAVRDPGGSDPDSRFVNPANAPLVQLPGTGTIWKISRVSRGRNDPVDDQ